MLPMGSSQQTICSSTLHHTRQAQYQGTRHLHKLHMDMGYRLRGKDMGQELQEGSIQGLGHHQELQVAWASREV